MVYMPYGHVYLLQDRDAGLDQNVEGRELISLRDPEGENPHLLRKTDNVNFYATAPSVSIQPEGDRTV
jgi:hypothetical protein